MIECNNLFFLLLPVWTISMRIYSKRSIKVRIVILIFIASFFIANCIVNNMIDLTFKIVLVSSWLLSWFLLLKIQFNKLRNFK